MGDSSPLGVSPTARNTHIIRFIIVGNLHQGRRERSTVEGLGSSSRRPVSSMFAAPGGVGGRSRASAPELGPDHLPGYVNSSLKLAYAIPIPHTPSEAPCYNCLDYMMGRNHQSTPDNWHDWRGLLILDDVQQSYEYTSFWNDLIRYRRPGEVRILALFSSYESQSRQPLPLQILRSDVQLSPAEESQLNSASAIPKHRPLLYALRIRRCAEHGIWADQ